MAGELTLHGVTRTVTFDVEGPSEPGKDPWGNTRIGLSATTKINRKDFGLSWNAALETGGVLVGEDVTITLDVQFIKAKNQRLENGAQRLIRRLRSVRRGSKRLSGRLALCPDSCCNEYLCSRI